MQKKARELLPFLDKRNTALIAAHCLINSEELRNSSRLLLQNGHYGPARSLAISAREEYGKFVFCISYLAGYIDKHRLADTLFSHLSKQAISRLISRVALKSKEVIPDLNLDDYESIEDIKCTLIGWMKSVIEHVDNNDLINDHLLSTIKPELESTLNANDEKLRQDGIYVTPYIKDDLLVINNPAQVSMEEVERELALLHTLDSNSEDETDDNDLKYNIDDIGQLLEHLAQSIKSESDAT